jgi:hypothetical protein
MGKLTLAVSFYGPFVFDFEKQRVTVYAPLCDGHFASVQTDVEEVGMAVEAPKKAYEYQLRERNNTKSEVRKPVFHAEDNILIVDSLRRKAKPPAASECQFKLQVPLPNQVIGLVADRVSIMEYDLPNPGTGTSVKKATSMRFNYYDIEDTKFWEVVQRTSPTSTAVTVPIKAVPPANYVQLIFRYNSGTPTEGHKDAEGCFQAMRNLFPPLGAWKVKFDDQRIDNHLSDCHATQIVFR